MLLQATKARWGATIDFAAFYYQFPLDVAVRRFFTVRSGEHYYVPLRLPMGFKASASIAQSVTVHLMVQASPANLFTDPYIDGILVLGMQKLEVEGYIGRLCKILNAYGVQTSEVTEVSQHVTYRGVSIDLEQHRFRMSNKFIEKFSLKHQDFAVQARWGVFRSLFAMKFYEVMARGLSLASVVSMMRFAARHACSPPNKIVTLWPSIIEQVQREFHDLQRNEWQALPADVQRIFTQAMVVASDASTEMQAGGAVVCLPSGDVSVSSFPLQLRHIHLMEAEALRKALESIEVRESTLVHVCVDNTALLGALLRGYSMTATLHEEIVRIMRWVERHRVTIHPVYIPTKLNPADSPSRLAPISDDLRCAAVATLRSACFSHVPVVAGC